MSSASPLHRAPLKGALPTGCRLGIFGLAIVASAALVWLHVQWLDEPWEQTHAGIVSEQLNYASNAFGAHGYVELRGQNAMAFLPFTEKGFFAKLHHPQIPYGAYHGARTLAGSPQQGMRSLSLGFLVLALLAIFMVGRREGAISAALAVAFFATAPAVIRDGRLVDGLLMAVALIPLTVWSYLKWRERAERRCEQIRSELGIPPAEDTDDDFIRTEPTITVGWYWVYFLVAWLGGMTSWYAYVLVPVLWVDLFFSQGLHGRFLRSAFVIGLPFGISLLMFVGWTLWALPNSVAVEDTFRYLFEVAAGKDYYTTNMNASLTSFLGARLWNGFGPVLLALVAVGVLSQVLRRPPASGSRRWARGTWLLMVAGLLAQVIFRTRAATHDHWVLLWAPGLALMAAHGALFLVGLVLGGPRRSVYLQFPAVAALSALLITSGWQGMKQHDAANSSEGIELAAAFDNSFEARDVVLICGPFPPGFRSSARSALMPSMVVELYDWSCGVLAPAKEEIAKLYIASPASELARNPWLAQLPLQPTTMRSLSHGGREWWVVELDKDRALDLEQRATRPR